MNVGNTHACRNCTHVYGGTCETSVQCCKTGRRSELHCTDCWPSALTSVCSAISTCVCSQLWLRASCLPHEQANLLQRYMIDPEQHLQQLW